MHALASPMDSKDPAVTIVLPTYNEAESLPVIVPRIDVALRAADIAYEIVVVDDNSSDGTADVAARLAEQYPVRVIKRIDERGLATAVLAGFAHARAPICVVMDADGSHPVSALPTMVRMLEQDKADIVVGSRHVTGGGSHGWPLFSQLKSRLAASLTFGLTSMTDPTTGLMAVRKSLLEGLHLDPVGWKIVLEIVVKTAPARIAEVPIVFEDRELGQSKQSLRVALQYGAHVGKLYSHRYPAFSEFIRFCMVGLLGLFVDLGTVAIVKESLGLDTRLCAVVGFAVAVSVNFVLNRRFTFAGARHMPGLWSYLTYVGTNMLGLAVRMLVVHAMIVFANLDDGRGYLISNASGIALGTLFNFVGAKYFAFDPQRLSTQKSPGANAPVRSPTLPAWLTRGCILVCVSAVCVAALAATSLRADATHDEQVNTTMALNMLGSFDYVVHPSVYPAGPRDWRTTDLPALGNTPFFPGLLALASAVGGLTGMRLVPLFSFLTTILFGALLAREHSPRAGLYSAMLLASSPSLMSQSLMLEFEPTLTAFSLAGLYLAARGTRVRKLSLCFAGGALLGFGFLTKMWLTVPYALAACAFVLVQTTLVRARDAVPLRLRRSVLAALSGFALTAGLHLLFVAIASPSDLPFWVKSVYLGIFSGQGVTGSKLSALSLYVPKPLWYYPAVLYRDHFYLVPLTLFGLPALLRRTRPQAMLLLAMVFGACMGVVLLSVPAVKEPLYVLSVAPFLYLLAGTCLAELDDDSTKYTPANATAVQAALVFAGLSTLAIWVSALSHSGSVSVGYSGLHSLGMVVCAAVGITWLSRHRIATALLTACAFAVVLCAANALLSRTG